VKLLALDQVMEFAVLGPSGRGNLEPRGLATAEFLDVWPEDRERVADPPGM
jgi:hypothetical protein